MSFRNLAVDGLPFAGDVQQVLDAFTGKHDVGSLSLFAPVAAPGALTATDSGLAGNVTGTVSYRVTLVTGYKNGDGTFQVQGETPGGALASLSVTSHQVNLTNIPTGPVGTIFRRIYRTASGGADGTQKLLVEIQDNITTSYVDNIADASLGTAMPTSNTTGSNLSAPQLNITGLLPKLQMLVTTAGQKSFQITCNGTSLTIDEVSSAGVLVGTRVSINLATGFITGNVDQVDGQHFQTSSGYLQYSPDGASWSSNVDKVDGTDISWSGGHVQFSQDGGTTWVAGGLNAQEVRAIARRT